MARFTLALLALLQASWTIADVKESGFTHLSISYQFIRTDGLQATTGELDIGKTDAHTLYVETEYALDTRWSLSAGLPLIRKRYRGPAVHDPAALEPPSDEEFIDDGDYHTSFQDLHLAVHYKLKPIGPVSITPFFGLGLPTNDYPFFANAAVGQNLWQVDIGAKLLYKPYFSDYYLAFQPSYVVVEETLGVNINHWRLNAELGYFLSNSVKLKTFVIAKEGNGLDFPDDFPQPRNDERWLQHDRMVKHNYVNVGLGVDWSFDSEREFSLSMFRMVHADVVHILDYAISLSYEISF